MVPNVLDYAKTNKKASGKCTRFQFSLRVCFALLTIAACVLGWYRHHANVQEVRQRIMRQFGYAPSSVKWKGRQIERLQYWSTSNLGDLRLAPELRSLTVFSGDLTDDELRELRHVRDIDELTLMETNISNESLVNLRHVPHLRELDLSYSSIDDGNLRELTRLRDLRTLALRSTNVTDVGLAALSSLPNLRVLWIDGTRVTEQGSDQA